MIYMKHKRPKAEVTVATSQAAPVHATCWLLLPLLLGLLLVSANSAAARQAEGLDTTIQHLITYVRESDVTFERNFSRHDSVAAAAHIDKKYQHFRDKIETPEQFIELCATASLVTGRPYMIIDGQGEEIPAGEWLNIELARYRLQNAQ
jgi:hypothetical protein